MPVFKDFAENGELLQTRDEPLNADNLLRYAEENTVDRVQGYIDCLEDMTKEFKNFLEIHGEKSWRYDTPHKIKKGTIKVYEEKELLLEFAKAFVQNRYSSPPNVSNSNSLG